MSRNVKRVTMQRMLDTINRYCDAHYQQRLVGGTHQVTALSQAGEELTALAADVVSIVQRAEAAGVKCEGRA